MSDTTKLIPVAEIGADGSLFQFKLDGDSKGVTGTLHTVKRWEPCFAGLLVIWQSKSVRSDGFRYVVVDGHQRLDLAKRLKVETLRCCLLREVDGWPVSRARAFGAAKNIAEGGETTDAISVAKLIRGDAKVEEWFGAMPSGRKCFKDGSAIARVPASVFELILHHGIDVDYAAAIASTLDNEEHQLAAVRYLAKCPPNAQTRADFLVGQIKVAGFSTNQQDTLFGILSESNANMEHCAAILEATVKHLRAVKRAFKTVINFNGELSDVGNKLKVKINKRERAANESLAEEIVQLATFPGPVSDSLREAAERLVTGNDMDDVVKEFVATVRETRRRKTQTRERTNRRAA